MGRGEEAAVMNRAHPTNKSIHKLVKERVDLTDELRSALRSKGLELDLRLIYDTKAKVAYLIDARSESKQCLIDPNNVNETTLLIALVKDLGFNYNDALEALKVAERLKRAIVEVLSPDVINRKLGDPISSLINDLDFSLEEVLEILKRDFSDALRNQLIALLRSDPDAISDPEEVPFDETLKVAKKDKIALYMVSLLRGKGLKFVKVGGEGVFFVARGRYARPWSETSIASSIASIFGVFKSGITKVVKEALWYAAEDVSPEDLNPPDMMLFKNGCLDLSTMSFTASEKSKYYFTTMIDCNLDPLKLKRFDEMTLEDWEEEVPKFISLLKRLFPEELEFKKCLEMLGALLIPSVVRKIFVIQGDPRIGKSTFVSVLSHCFKGCFSHVPLTELGDKFNYQLLGKFANISSEASDVLLDVKLMSALNRLVGEPIIAFEEKYRPRILARNMLKIVVVTNNLPMLTKFDEAFIDRLYIIRATGKLIEEERAMNALMREAMEEKEGVIHFVLWNMMNVYEPSTGKLKFKYDLPLEEKKELLLRELNPVNEWIEECCVRSGYEERKTLYASYYEWSRRSGRIILSKQQFYSVLRSLGFIETRIHGADCFKGLSLKPEARRGLGTIEDYVER
ncbi:MAG: DUF5906 domain-containing protein [Candidatus Nezhaarchaeales archaeon]